MGKLSRQIEEVFNAFNRQTEELKELREEVAGLACKNWTYYQVKMSPECGECIVCRTKEKLNK